MGEHQPLELLPSPVCTTVAWYVTRTVSWQCTLIIWLGCDKWCTVGGDFFSLFVWSMNYHIAGSFGEVFNLAKWWICGKSPNLEPTNIISYTITLCRSTHDRKFANAFWWLICQILMLAKVSRYTVFIKLPYLLKWKPALNKGWTSLEAQGTPNPKVNKHQVSIKCRVPAVGVVVNV